MAEPQDQDQDQAAAADIAREAMIRTAVTFGIEFGLVLAASAVMSHHEELTVLAVRCRDRIRRRWRGRGPADTELQVADFRRDISEIGHASGT